MSRGIRAVAAFAGILALLGLAMYVDADWFDAAYVGVLLVLGALASVRMLVRRYAHKSSDYGAFAALPDRWRRWMLDEHPSK